MTVGSVNPAWSSAGIGSPRIGSHILGSSSSKAHASIRTSVESSLAYLSRPKSGRSTIDRVSKSSQIFLVCIVCLRQFLYVRHDRFNGQISKPFASLSVACVMLLQTFLRFKGSESVQPREPNRGYQFDRER